MDLPRISIGFLGNINYDTRTYNLLKSLKQYGHNVVFNGYDWLTPEFESYEKDCVSVQKLIKGKISLLFYLQFAFNLLGRLLKQKSDIYFASDVYSLPFCVIAAKLKRKKVFYDAREVYTELPALNHKKITKTLMRVIEGHYIKKADVIFTTGKMDSVYIENLYKLHSTEVLRNLPLLVSISEPIDLAKYFENINDCKLLVYQGIIVKGRGLDTCFKALAKSDKYKLIVLGGGEHKSYYEQIVIKMKLENKVKFLGKIPQESLLNYTAGADIGISIIDNTSKNSFYALPNKMFEYIMAQLPVIVSDLPQMKEIVDEYKVGIAVPEQNVDALLNALDKLYSEKEMYDQFKNNCIETLKILNWENEFEKVHKYFI